MPTSDFVTFSKLPYEERLNEIVKDAGLTEEEKAVLQDANSLSMAKADKMIDNVIGRYTLPIGMAVGLRVNGKVHNVPMVTEEPSVVLGCSYGGYMAEPKGGFFTSTTGSVMIAQIMLLNVPCPENAKAKVLEHEAEIKELCDSLDPVLVRFGGGMVGLDVRTVPSSKGAMVIVHLKVDTRDAMGANAVNTMAEGVAPLIEKITGGEAYTRILSNLAVHRLVRSRATIVKEMLGGESTVDRICATAEFAEVDPFRAATHNKGIMNAITPIVIATGNDFRAVESGCHSYAAYGGQYTSLTHFEKNADGDLECSIETPMAVGTVGGVIKSHPMAGINLKIMGVETAEELASVIVSAGLSLELSALRSLATDGMQKGFLAGQARSLAEQVGAEGELYEKIVAKMIADKKVSLEYAQELFAQMK
ncbi:MAG: hydroxymethylglutaryl-CoA reductase, degradative [Eubacteriales bacterium]|nr:hydroxymethylglutaryl-CoA reductase, degradative [Eubacteriales bacterium]